MRADTGEGDPQKVRTHCFGPAIERALKASGWTNDAAAREMGYGDNQTSLRRWIENSENPQFGRLWRLGERFRQEFVMELAIECGFRMVVTLERKRA